MSAPLIVASPVGLVQNRVTVSVGWQRQGRRPWRWFYAHKSRHRQAALDAATRPLTVASPVGCAVHTNHACQDGGHGTPYALSRAPRARGFTLLEAVAALAVAAIALLSLLQLQLLAMRTADRAQTLTQAVLLAQEKMAEALAGGYPAVGVTAGLAQANGSPFTWRLEVTDTRVPVPAHQERSAPRPAGGDGLRRLSVEVHSAVGSGAPPIHLTTFVAQNQTRD